MRRRTLVGRMALVQIALLVFVLAALFVLSFFALTRVLVADWDGELRASGEKVTNLIGHQPERLADTGWVADEISELRPDDIRVEIRDTSGRLIVEAGPGPRFETAPERCGDRLGWRVCSTAAGPARVITALAEAPALSARNRFFLVTAAAALLLAVLVSLLARRITARALRSLSELTARVGSVRPGEDRQVGVTSDLEELRRLTATFDDLLERTHQAMERTREALARERRFAAEASHELRTPLTVLRAEIEGLVRGGVGEAERALRSVHELVGLVESLLWLSRAQSPFDRSTLEVVNLADLAREEVAAASARYGRGNVALEAPEETLVAADERLLRRAIANLLDNAFKYSPPGGTVEVNISARDGRAVASIADQGPGVPTDVRERIFEPFFRGPRHRAETPGFGLGLPLARAVARAHAGEVELVACSPQGSRFELSLPLG